MQILSNGWHVPDQDEKMFNHVKGDTNRFAPNYEKRQRLVIDQEHPNKKTFLDVGANIGVWSLAMQNKFENVIAFEPSTKNLECLRLNWDGEIREYAVGDVNSTVVFKDSAKNCGNGKVRPDLTVEGSAYEVEMVKLDDQNITDCSLIKIDVQGFEWQVVQGAQNLIETQLPWVTVEPNQDITQMVEFFFNRGYKFVEVKSKRTFIFAPTTGPNCPRQKAFGIRPSTQLVLDEHNIEVKQ
tara:strand:+ start:320 stop:1039 length:720 start_codon:yes stop_codon:yes gene_type:complete